MGNRGLWVQIPKIFKVFFCFFVLDLFIFLFSFLFFLFLFLLICGANQGLFWLENLAV